MQNTLIKSLVALFMLIVLLLTQVSCSQHNKPVDLPNDSITIGQITRFKTLNPILEFSGVSAQILNIIFDGLIRKGDEGEILPNVAVSWEMNNEGRDWIFHLRHGVEFHDGYPLTAADVEFTFNLIRDPNVASPYFAVYQHIREIHVRDSYTIDIQLAKPSPSFIYDLTIGIMPKHLLQGLNFNLFNYHPIGTGPYQCIRWSPDRVELGANQNYFLGRAHLDRVVIRSFENQGIAWAHLMKGDIDVLLSLNLTAYEIIKKISCFNVYSNLRPYYYIICFNMDNPLFQDRRVRQALNYAIDKQSIVDKVIKERKFISSGTISPYSWAFDSTLKPYPCDPKKALMLLAEAGWKDTDGDHILDKNNQPFTFQLCLPKGHDEIDTASLMLMEQLSNIGVMVRVKKVPVDILTQNYLLTKKFEGVFLYINSGDDPDKNYQFWHSSHIKNGFNFFSYRNSRIDQLLDEGRAATDRQERKELYSLYQQQMKEDPPGIFLFWRETLISVHKRFHGVKFSPFCGTLDTIREWYVPGDD
ncbi:MAG: ABC transporter substrate-binding protein [bacterium]